MGFILKLLGGALGPHILGGAGLVLALALGFAGAQTLRLHHAKADLSAARAALTDPATKRTWQVEATERARDLVQCRANATAMSDAIAHQNAATEAAAAEGRIHTAEAEKAVQAARTATQRAEAQGRAILSRPLVGGDQCSRLLAVDDLFAKELGR